VKMTYTQSQYDVPNGKYLARFLGVTMREDKPGDKPRLGDDGKPLPPAMTWDFEIAEGSAVGKRCDKLTGRVPTPKSGCGKMLMAIADAVLADGQSVELDDFVGSFYRVAVIDNRVSDSPAPVRVQAPTAGAAFAAAPAGRPSAGDPAARWDASDGAAVMPNLTSFEVQAFLNENKVPADRIRVKPAGGARELAKPANEYGFISGDVVPW
jgi:hypothetical protein